VEQVRTVTAQRLKHVVKGQIIRSETIRWMTHDPSSPPTFLVPETGHQKLVSKLRTPDTRNWYEKHGRRTWVVCHGPKVI